jgi:hypothetical protein
MLKSGMQTDLNNHFLNFDPKIIITSFSVHDLVALMAAQQKLRVFADRWLVGGGAGRAGRVGVSVEEVFLRHFLNTIVQKWTTHS